MGPAERGLYEDSRGTFRGRIQVKAAVAYCETVGEDEQGRGGFGGGVCVCEVQAV